MKTTDLVVSKRAETGKKIIKDLRKADQIPGVIYDHGNAIHISVDSKEVRKVIYTEDTYIINLDVEGDKMDAIVRSADFHPVTDRMQHIELLRVTDERPVTLTLPLKFEGTAKGVVKGGKLTIKLRKVKVKGIPSKLPERIMVNVSGLDLGETIKVKDAKVAEGVQILTPASAAVASVIIPRALRSAKSAEAKGGEVVAEEEE
jgi:large subunit ribosomal protein L25